MKVMPKKSRNDHVEFTENGLLQIINSNNDSKLVLNLNVKMNGTKKSVLNLTKKIATISGRIICNQKLMRPSNQKKRG